MIKARQPLIIKIKNHRIVIRQRLFLGFSKMFKSRFFKNFQKHFPFFYFLFLILGVWWGSRWIGGGQTYDLHLGYECFQSKEKVRIEKKLNKKKNYLLNLYLYHSCLIIISIWGGWCQCKHWQRRLDYVQSTKIFFFCLKLQLLGSVIYLN